MPSKTEARVGRRFRLKSTDPWRMRDGGKGNEVSLLECVVTRVNERSFDWRVDKVLERHEPMPGKPRWAAGDEWNTVFGWGDKLIGLNLLTWM